MKNVSESAFSSNLPVNFKVYNIIQNLRQNVNKLLTHRLRSYFIDRFEPVSALNYLRQNQQQSSRIFQF